MKKVAFSIAAVLFLSFVGCGGDGGDDDPDVGGTWIGALTLITNTCQNSNAPQTINFTHTVAQNGEAVTLVDQNGIQFLGNVVGEEGFSVNSNAPAVAGTVACAVSIDNQIEYSDVNDTDDQTASVELTVSCPNSCELRYTGTAARGGAVPTPTGSPNPSPSPNPTGTPAPGSCADINPNPAAGTYAGDGGCGISDVEYSSNDTTVILEPFGSNGATSFAIGANPSTAVSNNNNLTINGQAGFECSLTCSPPLTFTVSCFMEGGTTCTEKF